MTSLKAIRWLVYDTLRQATASGVCWLMLGVTGLCIVALSTAHPVSGEDIGPGDPPEAWTRVEFLFGLARTDLPGDREQAVRALHVRLAGGVADGVGLLLALLWTAGLLPAFLSPDAVTVLLVKPLPRWKLLLGKCFGIVVFLAWQAGLFVALTWLALGLRTGVWPPRYFLCLPLLLLNFGVFFSFSVRLAAATRNTVACVFGSVAFWMFCWATNLRRQAFRSLPDLEPTLAGAGRGVEVAYWLLPKPLDAHLLLAEWMRAGPLLPGVVDVPRLAQSGAWHPVGSLLASAAFAAALLAVAAYEFSTADY
jgi:hypothetical protein